MRSLNLEELKKLLSAVEREIALLPPGPARDKQMEYRSEISADIQMILWAQSPGLNPPSGQA